MIKWIALVLILSGCSIVSTLTARGEGLMFEFSNPSFSGTGFSTHALSIAQLEFNRKKDVLEAQASAEARAAREEANSILNKFLNNVESRIYAQLSKQLVDNMFGIYS
jgi:ATP phosphoribosyltransferase regulatory subunit HisZ